MGRSINNSRYGLGENVQRAKIYASGVPPKIIIATVALLVQRLFLFYETPDPRACL